MYEYNAEVWIVAQDGSVEAESPNKSLLENGLAKPYMQAPPYSGKRA